MPNLEHIILPKETRDRHDACNCFMCLTGRDTKNSKSARGRGHTKATLKVMKDAGKFGASSLERLPMGGSFSNSLIKEVCCKCHQLVGRGIQHKCTVKSARINIESQIDNLPQTQMANDGICNKLPLSMNY